MDKIIIKNLACRCIIGIEEWERREKQDVIINITLFLPLKTAGEKDNISFSIDYKKVKKDILNYVEESSHYTLEALAENIANICLKYVKKVIVRVDKPGALRFAESVAVEIERTSSD